jgi:hypothetical protein
MDLGLVSWPRHEDSALLPRGSSSLCQCHTVPSTNQWLLKGDQSLDVGLSQTDVWSESDVGMNSESGRAESSDRSHCGRWRRQPPSCLDRALSDRGSIPGRAGSVSVQTSPAACCGCIHWSDEARSCTCTPPYNNLTLRPVLFSGVCEQMVGLGTPSERVRPLLHDEKLAPS